jgi:hypothetical protein
MVDLLSHRGDHQYPLYQIQDAAFRQRCGPCYFREGFSSEIPTRMTVKEMSGLFGSPQMDPKLLAHVDIAMGLMPPQPGEDLKSFRRRREHQGYSRPTPKLFPFASALWKLMGFQPPLALALLRFCEGYAEDSIASAQGDSLFGIHIKLSKATRIANKWT